MDQVSTHKISYRDMRQGNIPPFDDKYGILSEYLSISVCKTLLANPYLFDDDTNALDLIVSNNTIIGRSVLMPTQVRLGDVECTARSVVSLEISEQYQGKGLGRAALSKGVQESNFYIGQLYSTGAISIIRKLGLVVFEMPSYYKLCKSRAFLNAKGIRGITLQITATVFDCILRVLDTPNRRKLKILKEKYTIVKEKQIPDWVEDITLKDGHMFSEIHNKEWLQWCLDYRFTDSNKDSQIFYAVYDKTGKPHGFFMTKVRYWDVKATYHNVTEGTLVEWGSYNENLLTEADLNLLALDSLKGKVDNIVTVLSDKTYDKLLRKMGFFRHGYYQVSIKPDASTDKTIEDQKNWRLRYGGCNTIVF